MTLKATLGIATTGRPVILAETLRVARRQTLHPSRVIVCASGPADVTGIAEAFPEVEIVFTEKGLPRQRNAIMEAAPETDIILFIDDDFFMGPDYLQAMISVFESRPRTVVTTGHVIADGIGGPGLGVEEGHRLLEEGLAHAPDPVLEPAFSGYGCNMAIDARAARRHGVRFDPRLPLYGWQEDVDMTRRLAAHGEMLKVRAARGVHLGVKSGRGSGRRLGYSQIANPIYLHANSDYPLRFALQLMGRNVISNLVRSFWQEPYVDRRGRLQGNLLAIGDLIRRRLTPERALDI